MKTNKTGHKGDCKLLFSLISVVFLLSSCSLFSPGLADDKRLYFSQNTFLYQEYNFSDRGELKLLIEKYPFVADLKEAFLQIKTQNEDNPAAAKEQLAKLLNAEFAIGMELPDPKQTQNENASFLLHIKVASKNFLRELASQVEKKSRADLNIQRSTENHRGVKIVTYKKNNGDSSGKRNFYSYALLGDYETLVADNPQTIIRAIDRGRSQKGTLLQNPDFVRDFTSIDPKHLASWFINYDQYREFTEQEIARLQSDDAAQYLTHPVFKGKNVTTFTVAVTDKGLSLSRNEKYNELPAEFATFKLNHDLMTYIPRKNLFWMHGQQLDFIFKLIYDTFVTEPGIAAQIAGFEKASNINIKQDIIAWLDGEFLLAMIEAKKTETATEGNKKLSGENSSLPIDGAIIMRGQSAEKTLRSWRKLEPIIVAILQALGKNGSQIKVTADDSFKSITLPGKIAARELDLDGPKKAELALIYGVFPGSDNFFIAGSRNMLAKMTAAKSNGDALFSADSYRDLNLPIDHISSFGFNLPLIKENLQARLESTLFAVDEIPTPYTEKIKPFLDKFAYFGGFSTKVATGERGDYTLFISQ